MKTASRKATVSRVTSLDWLSGHVPINWTSCECRSHGCANRAEREEDLMEGLAFIRLHFAAASSSSA